MPLTANSRSPSSRLDPYMCPPAAPGARSCSSLARAPSPYPLPAPRTGIAPPPTTPAIGLPLMKPHPPPTSATRPSSSRGDAPNLLPHRAGSSKAHPPSGWVYMPPHNSSPKLLPLTPPATPRMPPPFSPPFFQDTPFSPFRLTFHLKMGWPPHPISFPFQPPRPLDPPF